MVALASLPLGVVPLNPVCVGVDVGQITDPTAIAVAEACRVHTGQHHYQLKQTNGYINSRGEWVPPKGADPVMRTEYTIRHITRLPLGTSYPAVAAHIADMLCNPRFARRSVRVLIDVTGVGRPVYDSLKSEIRLRKEARHILLLPISFVHGETYNKRTGALGKAYLVSRLQSLLQSGRFHAPDTLEVKAMLDELRVYEIRVNNAGTDQYGAFQTGKHDDLATAAALSALIDPFSERTMLSERVY